MQHDRALHTVHKEELKAFVPNKSCIHHVPKPGMRPMLARQGRELIMSTGDRQPATQASAQAGTQPGSAAGPGKQGAGPGKDAQENRKTAQGSPPLEGGAPHQPHQSHISRISREEAERNLVPDPDPDDPVSP